MRPSLALTVLVAVMGGGPAFAQDGPLILLPSGQSGQAAQPTQVQPAPAPQPQPQPQTIAPAPLDLSGQPAASDSGGLTTTLTRVESDTFRREEAPVVPLPRLNPRHFGGGPIIARQAPGASAVEELTSSVQAILDNTSPSPPPLTSAPPNGTSAGLLPSPTDNRQPALPVSTGDAGAGNVDLAYGAFQRGYYLSAFSLAIARAEQGDTAAQTLLGLIYEGGYGIARDLEEAAAWYEFAAAGGDREAQFALGMMYLEGRGVATDRARAADFLEAAAAGGKTAAKYNLGLLYLEGQARPQDFQQAAQFFTEAAQAGSPDAQYVLAQLYAEGRGMPVDEATATSWFSEASRLGHVPAQVEYAIRLFNGVGIQKDEATAAAWFRRAADLGDPIAQNRYARLLATGRGTEQNSIEAAKYHFLASSAGRQDSLLDDVVNGLTPEERRIAVVAAQRWPAN